MNFNGKHYRLVKHAQSTSYLLATLISYSHIIHCYFIPLFLRWRGLLCKSWTMYLTIKLDTKKLYFISEVLTEHLFENFTYFIPLQ